MEVMFLSGCISMVILVILMVLSCLKVNKHYNNIENMFPHINKALFSEF
jgi:hypothetical protein